MKTLFTLGSLCFAFFCGAQSCETFIMTPDQRIFAHPLQVKYFNTKDSDEEEKKLSMLLYFDHFENIDCHKMLNTISRERLSREINVPYDSITKTPMELISGHVFIHEGNLDLHSFKITNKRYDLNVAMILRDTQTGKYLFYIPICADSPLPFFLLNIPYQISYKEKIQAKINFKKIQNEAYKIEKQFAENYTFFDDEKTPPLSRKEQRKHSRKERKNHGL